MSENTITSQETVSKIIYLYQSMQLKHLDCKHSLLTAERNKSWIKKILKIHTIKIKMENKAFGTRYDNVGSTGL